MTQEQPFDLLILGAGLSGSMLAAIMARHGHRVLLLDAGTHPRFAIGEATTPDTSFRLKLLAAKYDVPEFAYLSQFYLLRDHVGPTSGIKRAFSFLYHRHSEDHVLHESHQFPTGAPPWGPDCHLFRQDTDTFMLTTAARYGAIVQQKTRVTDIDIDPSGVVLRTEAGAVYRGAYLVDAAGYRSPVASQLQLRGDPARMRTNSRAIFTHMIDVVPYDELGHSSRQLGLTYPLSQTTLHHVFPGGWFWVIPFGNHLDATNHLCSVGLLLDRTQYPETGQDPASEFFAHVRRFPRLARQFSGARAVRDWVSTGRLQYWSHRSVGDRYCLLAHAAGFVDPLYSSGLNLTVGVLDLLGAQLLQAFRSGDFSGASFAYIDQFFQDNLQLYDELVANSYLSWQDYDLWDAWYRVWVAVLQVGTYMNGTQLMRYHRSHEHAVLEQSRHPPYTGLLGSKWERASAFYRRAAAHMDRYREGRVSAAQAARAIRALIEETSLCPSYWRLYDTDVRTTPPYTMSEMVRAYAWYWTHAPRDVREHLVGFPPWTASHYALRSLWTEHRRNWRRHNLGLRDAFRAWNDDWRHV